MLIKHNNCNNCRFNGFLRIVKPVVNNENNEIYIYPCCIACDDDYPLLKLTYDELLNNNFYDIVNGIYETTKYYPVLKYCKEFPENEHIKECKFYSEPLKLVDISILHNCNLNCVMCTIPNDDDKKILELYFKLLNDLKQHNIGISFTQLGEPFYYKKEVISFLKALKPNDYTVIRIISNLTLLNDDDIELLDKINKMIMVEMYASIDGITEKTYKKVRKNNLFNKVIHNAKLLIEKKIIKQINFVAQDLNIHEINDAYNYWSALDVRFQPIIVYDGKDPSHHERIKNSNIYKNFLYNNNVIV